MFFWGIAELISLMMQERKAQQISRIEEAVKAFPELRVPLDVDGRVSEPQFFIPRIVMVPQFAIVP